MLAAGYAHVPGQRLQDGIKGAWEERGSVFFQAVFVIPYSLVWEKGMWIV
ncbi:hypothetical protein AALC25_14350 [Lachnospiraceae bacterium 29-84]